MFRSGRRLFTFASIALIAVGILHTIGTCAPGPVDPALERLAAEMRAYRLPLGLGMQPSIFDIQQSLSVTMSVTLLWLALQNLVAAGADSTGDVVRRLNILSVMGVGALVAVFAFYRIPPPLVTLAVVEVLFVLALVRSSRVTLSPGSAG
jgi:hypothetical protein